MTHDANSPYNRAAHDGEQAISTVTGLQTALDTKLEDADMQAAINDAIADIDLSGYQPVDSDLTAIAALTTTAFGRSLLAQSSASVNEYISQPASAGTRLRSYRSKAAQITSGITGVKISILTIGDSISGDITIPLQDKLFQAHGAAGQHGGGAQRGVITALAGGAAANVTADYAKWVTGGWTDVPAGGSFSYVRASYAFNATQAFTRGKVYYVKEVGGATFKIQTSPDGTTWTDVSGFASVSAVDTVDNLGIASFAVTGPTYIRVLGISGTAKIIGIGWEDSTGVRISFITSAGGLIMSNMALTPARIWRDYIADLSPDIAIFWFKDDTDQPMKDALATIQGHISYAAPSCCTIYPAPYNSRQDDTGYSPAPTTAQLMATARTAIKEFLAATTLAGEKIYWPVDSYLGQWSEGAKVGLYDVTTPVAISSCSIASSTITINATAHGITGSSGSVIFRVNDVVPSEYNGLYTNGTVVNANQITVPAPTVPPTASGSGGFVAGIDATHLADTGRAFVASHFVRDFGLLGAINGNWPGSLGNALLASEGIFKSTGGTVSGATRFSDTTAASGTSEGGDGAAAIRTAGGIYAAKAIRSDIGFSAGGSLSAANAIGVSKNGAGAIAVTTITAFASNSNSSSASLTTQGIYASATVSPTGTANNTSFGSCGLYAEGIVSGGGTGTVNLIAGLFCSVQTSGGTTTGGAYGIALTGAFSSTVTAVYGIDINISRGSGTQTTAHGIRITTGLDSFTGTKYAILNSSSAPITSVGAITTSGLLTCGVFTFATVPSASASTGGEIRISDRAQRKAYSDGTNWRWIADDVIIS